MRDRLIALAGMIVCILVVENAVLALWAAERSMFEMSDRVLWGCFLAVMIAPMMALIFGMYVFDKKGDTNGEL